MMIVHNGDIISILYTNSPAMHSALMRQFSPNVPSAPINAFVAVQRRFQNVVHDGERQTQYEMLLGLHKYVTIAILLLLVVLTIAWPITIQLIIKGSAFPSSWRSHQMSVALSSQKHLFNGFVTAIAARR
jgi:hypothetical protein